MQGPRTSGRPLSGTAQVTHSPFSLPTGSSCPCAFGTPAPSVVLAPTSFAVLFLPPSSPSLYTYRQTEEAHRDKRCFHDEDDSHANSILTEHLVRQSACAKTTFMIYLNPYYKFMREALLLVLFSRKGN